MDKKFVVLDVSFDEVGIQSGSNVGMDNQFDDFDKAVAYAKEEHQKKNGKIILIIDYHANPKKIIEMVQ